MGIILNLTFSLRPNLLPSSFSICLEGTKAVMFSLKFIVAPLSTISVNSTSCKVPSENSFSYLSHGFS